MENQLIEAVTSALNGDWDRAHHIVQEQGDALACWIHAVLHKIEGDVWNSRYWYARTAHRYEDFADPRQELETILRELRDRSATD